MKTQLTYVGRVITSRGKLFYKYLDENNESNLYAKPVKSCAIGAIIECEKTDTGVRAPYDFIGKCEDQEKIDLWVQQDWANKKQIDIQRDMKKVPKTKYDDIVSDLNWILRGLPRSQRLLFKMKLINDLKE